MNIAELDDSFYVLDSTVGLAKLSSFASLEVSFQVSLFVYHSFSQRVL